MSYKFLRYDAGNIRTIAASKVIQILQIIRELVCHTFDSKKIVSQNQRSKYQTYRCQQQFCCPDQTIQTVLVHDMLSMSIHQQPYTVIPILLGSDLGVLGHLSLWSQNDGIMSFTVIPTLLGSDLGVLGHVCLWSQNDGIMSLLRATALSNCFLHPYQTYKKFLAY